MRTRARTWFVAVLVVAATTVGFAGGASNGAASTTEVCETGGRLFCTAITDQDGRSLSTASAHYMKYTVTIRNTGGSRLTNGTLTLTLTDIVGSSELPSTADYQAAHSTGLCSVLGSTTNVLSCSVPNLPAGASGTVTYDPLIFATSTTAGATETKMTALAAFKEKGSDKQPVDPNPDSKGVSELTSYEPDPDLDVSWAFPGAAINLATSTSDNQHSSFPLSIPGATVPFNARLEEGPVAGSFCPNCFGEIVSTAGGGIHSATNPVDLLITWNFKPSGFTENNPVHHDPDVGANEVITQDCTFDPGKDIPTNLPCRDIEIDQLGGGRVSVTIHVFSDDNGGWGVG